MSWNANHLDTNPVYITTIAESLDKSRLFIEVLSDPTTAANIGEDSSSDRTRVYELYRYGKTATASGGSSGSTSSSGSVSLGTTPVYQEGAMWIED